MSDFLFVAKKKFRIYDIPFVPSSNDRLETMMELANVKNGEKAVDLGSGDGKLVIALAKRGAVACGIEIDRERAKLARLNIAKEGVDAKIINKDFWDVKLGDYDVIVLYGITSIMGRLEKKIMKETKLDCRVISNAFTFPNWKPTIVKNNVYLYLKNP